MMVDCPQRLHPLALLVLLATIPLYGVASESALPFKESTTRQEVRDLPALPEGTVIEADRIEGKRGDRLTAEGEVRVVRGQQSIRADWLLFDEPANEVSAEGGVVLRDDQAGAEVSGPAAHYNLTTHEGVFFAPRYTFTPGPGQPKATPAHGQAAELFFEGENRYRIRQGTWTTCPAPQPDWHLSAKELVLDRNQQVGTATDVRLRFGDTTLLPLPWLEFPLTKERRSGWLVPSFGLSSRTGLLVATPYYFNLAPNYDLTLTPRLYSRRGVQLASQFRYLTPTDKGVVEAEVLPNDQEANRNRGLLIVRHDGLLADRLAVHIDYNVVGDRRYFKDLSNHLHLASVVHLLRQGALTYHGEGWGSQLMVQQYQTLDRATATPYRMLPQWRLWANPYPLAGGTLSLDGQVTAFRHPAAGATHVGTLRFVDGTRWIATPQWRLPIRHEWWFVEPRVMMHLSHYALDQPALVGGRTDVSRLVPIVALDAGIELEREWTLLNSQWLQTLEPRLFYRYAPYRYQDDLPLFDTDRFGFGFAQLFTMNPYTGHDRIADGHSLTAALTSRLIDPISGRERIRLSLGQRFYADDPKVVLPGEPVWRNQRTDLLAEVVWQPFDRWRAKGFWQYDPEEGVNRRFNAAVRYQAGEAKVVGFDYRRTRDLLEEVALSGQWPLASRWYGVSRVARSLKDDRWTELLGGLEYNGGCWVGRVVLHRYRLGTETTNTALFFQLELNGLGSLGSDPGSLLRRAVPGYGRITSTGPERALETGW